jgi:hypothetical protein
MAEVGRKRTLDGDGPAATRKKLRPSELPLSQAQRTAIDNLAHTFRKKGHYDSIRKDLLAQFEASVRGESVHSKRWHELTHICSPPKLTSSPPLKSSSIAKPTATHPCYPKTPESLQH